VREADHDDRGANGMGGKGTVSQLHEFDCMPAIFNSGGRLTEGEMQPAYVHECVYSCLLDVECRRRWKSDTSGFVIINGSVAWKVLEG